MLDTESEPSFDRLARLASKFLGVPVALVSLVDAERQFFKSCIGLPEPWADRRETPLSHSFCQHVVASGVPLVIDDARLDPRVTDNLAVSEIGVIAYLGIPLTIDGHVIGSFCAIDDKARHWTDEEIATLADLAESVVAEIRLRAEHAVTFAAKTRLQVTLSSIGDAVITTDATGSITFLNPIAEALCSCPNGEAIGRPLTEIFRIINETSRMPVANPVEKVLATNRIVGLANHTILIARDGTERFIDDSASPIRNEAGEIEGVVLVFRDITEKSRLDRELTDARTRLDSALDAGAIATWTWDIPGNRLVADANLARLFSVSPEDAAGGKLDAYLRAIHPDDVERVAKSIERIAREGGPYDEEYRVMRPDGSCRVVHARGSGVADDSGQIIALPGVIVDITENRRIEADRLRAEEFQRLIFESVKDFSIFTTDLRGTITSWNKGAENVFGFSEAETIGQPAALVFTPEDRARDVPEKEMRAAAETGQGIDERWHVRKDGSRFFASGMVTPLRSSDGQLIGFTKVARDITSRVLAAEQLRESEERYRTFYNSIEEGFCVVEMIDDDAGHPVDYLFLEVNPAFDRQTGLKGAANKTMRELAPTHDEHWFTTYSQVARTGQPARVQLFATALGNRWYDVSAYKVGKPEEQRVAVFFNDVTARIHATESLRRREQQYEDLFNSIDEGFCVIEMIYDETGKPCDYRYLEINPAFEKHTGLHDAVGRRIRDMAPDHEDRWIEAYAKVAQTGEDYRTEDEAATLEHRTYQVHAFRVGSPGEYKVAVLFTDITHRRRGEREREILVDQLTDADRRKDEFLAMLAHELRNPLAAIGSGVQLVQRTQQPELLAQLREMIQDQVNHLTHLIDDLLDVSRITQGKIELRKTIVELHDVVKKATDLARQPIAEKHHKLTVKLPPKPVYFVADPTRVEQVINNLLTNAAKYSDEARSIILWAFNQGGQVVFRIIDEGFGIAPEMLPKVFGLFTQVDATIDRARGGLGIGLTLVKSLVEMHGGTVEAKSEGKGKGSEFVVRLPIGQPQPLANSATITPVSTAPSDQSPAGRQRILIIDDNRDTARMTSRLLAHQGYEMTMAHDGFEGIGAAKAFKPDVILLDIGLPGLNGYEVAEALRDHDCCRDAIIIAVSGYGEAAARERSRQAGCDHHLTKPLDFDRLDEILRSPPDR